MDGARARGAHRRALPVRAAGRAGAPRSGLPPAARGRPRALGGVGRAPVPLAARLPRACRSRSSSFYELHVGTFTPEGTFDAAGRSPERTRRPRRHLRRAHAGPAVPGQAQLGLRRGVAARRPRSATAGRRRSSASSITRTGTASRCAWTSSTTTSARRGTTCRCGGRTSRTGTSRPGATASTTMARRPARYAPSWSRPRCSGCATSGSTRSGSTRCTPSPDDSPRHLVGALCDAVAAFAKESGRPIHVVAESDLEDRKVVDPPPRGWGCSAMWSDDFHHALHALAHRRAARLLRGLRGSRAARARAARRASPSRGRPRSSASGRGAPTRRASRPPASSFCAQNHDQVGNRPSGDRLSTLVPPRRSSPVATLLLLGPALPLLFMGEEYGEPRAVPLLHEPRRPALAKAVTEGRKSEHIADAGRRTCRTRRPRRPSAARSLTHGRDGWHGALWSHHRHAPAAPAPRAADRHAVARGDGRRDEPDPPRPGWRWR